MAQGNRTKIEMAEIHKTIDRLFRDGILNNQQIADEVGCSMQTVWKRRKEFNG